MFFSFSNMSGFSFIAVLAPLKMFEEVRKVRKLWEFHVEGKGLI